MAWQGRADLDSAGLLSTRAGSSRPCSRLGPNVAVACPHTAPRRARPQLLWPTCPKHPSMAMDRRTHVIYALDCRAHPCIRLQRSSHPRIVLQSPSLH